MCVIIKRDPGIIIPEEKILSACKVNPDGFGISVIDRGQMETVKIHKSGGNDPVEILKRLEDAKDQQVLLHLRYTTAGKTNEENCHPFQVFKGNNFEVQFMHNGTLSKFSKRVTDDHSDTWHFNEEILKPLVRAFYEVEGAGVLLSPTVKTILSEFKGASVFTLYDNEGNVLNIENSSCKQFEGWWASNEYSFNRTHRDPPTKPTTTNTRYEHYYHGYRSPYADAYDKYEDDYACNTNTKATTTNITTELKTAGQQATETESKKAGYAIMQAKKHGVLPRKLTPPEERLTFADMAEIEDIKDVMLMTEGDLYDLISELPLAATALLMDLIHELWVKDKKEKNTIPATTVITTVTAASGTA